MLCWPHHTRAGLQEVSGQETEWDQGKRLWLRQEDPVAMNLQIGKDSLRRPKTSQALVFPYNSNSDYTKTLLWTTYL